MNGKREVGNEWEMGNGRKPIRVITQPHQIHTIEADGCDVVS